MKKYLLILAVALISASCSTVLTTTATYDDADATFRPTISVADVEVSGAKISYTYIPTKQIRKGGTANIINEAVRQALRSAGNYDVLVAKETSITVKKKFFGSKISSVTVTGFPGNYVNWRSTEELVPVPEHRGFLGFRKKR
ncbi:MAG: hypothetical protein ACI3Z0_06555 [Candidatus Cryptobacteroides sp.]